MKDKKNIIIAAVATLVAVLIVILIIQFSSSSSKSDEIEQLKLQNEQLSLANEYEELSQSFQNYETQTKYLTNDSLVAKYTEAKDKVEKLLAELKTQKITSERRISELKSEISTLKGIMRHYIEQIDSLTKENKGLKAENKEIKDQNKKLNSRVNEYSQQNAELEERMTLAEKLNITGVSLTPLKKNGKREKKIKKAKQLMVTFTIPQNNSTPVGEKMIYIRITTPEGTLLDGGGSFEFEGSTVPYSACKRIEYTGEELANIQVYWDVNMTLTTGQYQVEIFADNYRIASRQFMMEK